MFGLEQLDGPEIELAKYMLENATDLEPGCRSPAAPPRTSAKKLRRVPPPDLRKLRAFAESSSHRIVSVNVRPSDPRLTTGHLAIAISTLSSRFAMRPCEFWHAKLIAESGRKYLEIENAKSTNGRGFADVPRRLYLDEFEDQPEMLAQLETLLSTIAAAATRIGAARLQARCAQWLARASRRLWPRRKRHLALYSGRHEAASLLKQWLLPAEVAATMGHAVDYTCGGYARRRAKGGRGHRPPLPRPCPKLVSRVRLTRRVRFVPRPPSPPAPPEPAPAYRPW
jgi:hypothetical protein